MSTAARASLRRRLSSQRLVRALRDEEDFTKLGFGEGEDG
jgi:hypothetical protein